MADYTFRSLAKRQQRMPGRITVPSTCIRGWARLRVGWGDGGGMSGLNRLGTPVPVKQADSRLHQGAKHAFYGRGGGGKMCRKHAFDCP
jgi:hypothetical protein